MNSLYHSVHKSQHRIINLYKIYGFINSSLKFAIYIKKNKSITIKHAPLHFIYLQYTHTEYYTVVFYHYFVVYCLYET